MVALCKRAEVGVGATIAPINHLEKGNCADLVNQANAKSIIGIITVPDSQGSKSARLIVFNLITEKIMAAAKPIPPRRFIHSARNNVFNGLLLSFWELDQRILV